MLLGVMLRWTILCADSDLKGQGDLHRRPQHRLPFEHTPHAEPLDHVGQALPFDELHRHPAITVGDASPVQANDILVLQGQHRFDRADEPVDLALVCAYSSGHRTLRATGRSYLVSTARNTTPERPLSITVPTV